MSISGWKRGGEVCPTNYRLYFVNIPQFLNEYMKQQRLFPLLSINQNQQTLWLITTHKDLVDFLSFSLLPLSLEDMLKSCITFANRSYSYKLLQAKQKNQQRNTLHVTLNRFRTVNSSLCGASIPPFDKYRLPTRNFANQSEVLQHQDYMAQESRTLHYPQTRRDNTGIFLDALRIWFLIRSYRGGLSWNKGPRPVSVFKIDWLHLSVSFRAIFIGSRTPIGNTFDTYSTVSSF